MYACFLFGRLGGEPKHRQKKSAPGSRPQAASLDSGGGVQPVGGHASPKTGGGFAQRTTTAGASLTMLPLQPLQPLRPLQVLQPLQPLLPLLSPQPLLPRSTAHFYLAGCKLAQVQAQSMYVHFCTCACICTSTRPVCIPLVFRTIGPLSGVWRFRTGGLIPMATYSFHEYMCSQRILMRV